MTWTGVGQIAECISPEVINEIRRNRLVAGNDGRDIASSSSPRLWRRERADQARNRLKSAEFNHKLTWAESAAAAVAGDIFSLARPSTALAG